MTAEKLISIQSQVPVLEKRHLFLLFRIGACTGRFGSLLTQDTVGVTDVGNGS